MYNTISHDTNIAFRKNFKDSPDTIFFLQYSNPYQKLLRHQSTSLPTIHCIHHIHSTFAIISFDEFLDNQNHHL